MDDSSMTLIIITVMKSPTTEKEKKSKHCYQMEYTRPNHTQINQVGIALAINDIIFKT